MLTNLLQNAAKFTDSGGQVVVRIQADDVRRSAVVSVIDTGVGIEPELLSRLFKVYTQGDGTLARADGGLGLGLAIVKSLAELQGGHVEAFSSAEGHGSEIRFSLPLTVTSAATPAVRETTIVAPAAATYQQTSKP